MNYTLNQLRIFLKVVQLQSITKASVELHLTQPAVSIQLKNFQLQFDIPLTETINKRLYITDFGKEIAIAAENILQEVKNIDYKTLAYKGELAGKLKISVVSTGKYIIPYFLASFLKQNEGVEIELDVTNRARVIRSLEKNEVDFSLVSVMPENLDLKKIELMKNKLFLVGNKQKIFKNDTKPIKFLESIPLIYREKGSGTRLTMEKYFAKNHIGIAKKIELTSNEAVKQAVIAGLGYSIMPLIGIKNELNNEQLQIISVKDFPINSNWHLVWLAQKKISPIAQAYLDYIKKEKENIIQSIFSWYEDY